MVPESAAELGAARDCRVFLQALSGGTDQQVLHRYINESDVSPEAGL